MPPPMVICSICSKNVMKAQTYHVGEGKRACKEHEGVLERKEVLEHQELLKRQAEEQKKSRSQQKQTFQFKNCCWVCQREALTQQEFAMKMMVAMERMEVKNLNVNPFSNEWPEQIRKELGGKILFTFLISTDGAEQQIKRFPKRTQMLCSVAGYINVCQDCSSSVGLKAKVPEITTDQLKNMSIAVTLVKPVIREMAVKELQEEGEKN